MNAQFLDKLNFYQEAYQEELHRAKEIRLNLQNLKNNLLQYISEKISAWLGQDLDEEESAAIERTGLSLTSIFEEIEENRKRLPLEIETLRMGEFYQQYLDMTINHDFSLIIALEDDPTFTYLITENFHNENFVNRPKIKFPLFGTFQPRFKKFARIAAQVAQRHRFENYQQMFETWATMRNAFREVVGDEKVKEAKVKFEKIQQDIRQKNEQLNNLTHKEIDIIIQKVSEFIFQAQEFTLSVLHAYEFNYIQDQKEKIRLEDQNLILVQNTVNQILKNMGFVQEIALKAHKAQSHPNIQEKLDQILAVKDPHQDLHEILSEEEWQKALQSFQEYDQKHFKNAKVHYEQAQYRVTDLTPEQIQYLMKKYQVKEGETFEPTPEDIRKLNLME